MLAETRELQRSAIAQAGGEEVDCRGDELFCVFSEPGAAALAALEIQRAFAARSWPDEERVRVRIGLHSGEAEREPTGSSASTSTGPRASARRATADRSWLRRRRRPSSAWLRGSSASSSSGACVTPSGSSSSSPTTFRRSFRPSGTCGCAKGGLSAVVADDSTLLREGLARLLEEAEIEVVGQARNADELMLKVRSYHPDVAIVDIRMPPTQTDEGIRAAREIRAKHPETGVLVLSQHVAHTYAVELLSESAQGLGYLLKDRVGDVDEFISAVRRVAEGGSALDPLVVAELVGRDRGDDPLEWLSPREREVLELMAEGRSNQAIGARLFISPRAVEKHVTSIFTKLRLPAAREDHRRVLAVLRFLGS